MGRAARARATRRAAHGSNVRLVNPNAPKFADYIRANAKLGCPVVERDSARAQSLVLCGAGPSLADHAEECASGDQVWACNGALPWLLTKNHRVTHGFTVEASERMLDVWHDAFGVDFLCASSADPALVACMILRGADVSLFHNVAGPTQRDVAEQDQLYASLYPPTICAGAGLNSVTRAIDVAAYMGFASITVLGADCCLRVRPNVFGIAAPSRVGLEPGTEAYDRWMREHAVMHVDGRNPEDGGCSPVTAVGVIDGREWTAQWDMWISAQYLVAAARADARVRLVGDTLPNTLLHQSDSFLAKLPKMIDGHGKLIPITV